MVSMDDDLAEAMTEVRAAQRGLELVQEQMTSARATVRSRNRRVSATVDARGSLVDLTFHGDGYKTMAGPELAALVLDTAQRAAKQCADEMEALLGTVFGTGFTPIDLTTSSVTGIDEIFTRAVLDRLPDLTDTEAENIRRSWREDR